MANGGPFGNPLTTGIALNFEVDMTPYRQMMQDNLDFAKNQAAERKKGQKEFQDILKNITYDDSKILKRRRDGAKVKYAELISDAIKLDKAGDVGGLTMRIAEFDSGMNNLVDEKTKFNTYEKLTREGKHFGSQGFIDAMNSVDDGETSDENIIEGYSANTIYDAKNGVFDMHAIPKADPMAFVNKALQGTALKTAVDGSGNPLKPTYLPETGEYQWDLSRVDDPEAFIQELGMAWAGGGESNIETMRMGMGLEPEDLGGDGAVTHSVEYIRKFVEPKLTGSRYSRKTDQGKAAVVNKDPMPQSRLGGRVSYSVNVNTLQGDAKKAYVKKIADASSAATAAAEADPDKLYTKDGFAGTSLWTELNDLNYKMVWSNSGRTLTVTPPADQDGQTRENEAREFDLRGGLLNTNNTGIWNDINGFVGGTLKAQELPEDKQVISSNKTYTVMQNKASALYGKGNLITIPGGSGGKAILTGQNELQVIKNPNPFSIRGNVVQILGDVMIETDGLPDNHVFKKAKKGGLLEEGVDYALIEPSQQIEGDTPDSLNWKKLKTGAAGEESYELMDSGIEISADGGNQILMPLTPQLRSYIKDRYGKTIDEMKKESRETIGR